MDSLLKPEALVKLAKAHGCRAVAMTDANLHGAVEFFMAAKQEGIKPVIAAEVMAYGKPFIAYVKDANGYQNLCAALSQPSRVLEPGQCEGLILRPAGWLAEQRAGHLTKSRPYGRWSVVSRDTHFVERTAPLTVLKPMKQPGSSVTIPQSFSPPS